MEKPNCFIAVTTVEEPSPTQRVFAPGWSNWLPVKSVTTARVKLASLLQLVWTQKRVRKGTLSKPVTQSKRDCARNRDRIEIAETSRIERRSTRLAIEPLKKWNLNGLKLKSIE